MEKQGKNNMGRREFLRRIGLGAGSALALMAMEPLSVLAKEKTEKNCSQPHDISHTAWLGRASITIGIWHDATA